MVEAEAANWLEITPQDVVQSINTDRNAQANTKNLMEAFEAMDSDQQMEMIWNHRAGLWRRLLVAFFGKLNMRGAVNK